MRNYQLPSSETTYAGFGCGNNAIEAFENAVDGGSMFIPAGVPADIKASSDNGISIGFEVMLGE